MGREAIIDVIVDGDTAEVRAVLESSELILRGAIKRRYSRASLEQVRIEGENLCFMADGEAVKLALGPKLAEAWRIAIETPSPTLRAKLGLATGARALLFGLLDDASLREALEDVEAVDVARADMIVARVETEADVENAMAIGPQLPIWFVYRKGISAPFGDGQIREKLRAAQYRDTKSCAVSDKLTATRYHPG